MRKTGTNKLSKRFFQKRSRYEGLRSTLNCIPYDENKKNKVTATNAKPPMK